MSIGVIVTGLLLAQQPQSAASLISMMFKHYSDAQSMAGTIRLVQSSMGKSLEIDTKMAFQKPSLMYLFQSQADGRREPSSLVSDGIHFAYTAPSNLDKRPPKLIESIHQRHYDITVPELYVVARLSLIERSLPLDVAIGRPTDLKAISEQLATFGLTGRATINGHEANVIKGELRDNRNGVGNGHFEMDITNDGDLVHFWKSESFQISPSYIEKQHLPMSDFAGGVRVEWSYDVDLAVNTVPDQSLFHL